MRIENDRTLGMLWMFFLSLSRWEFTRYSLENALKVSLGCSVLVSSSCRCRGRKGHCELLVLFYKALLLFCLEICKPPKRFSFVLAAVLSKLLATSLIKRAEYLIKISKLGVRSDLSPNDKKNLNFPTLIILNQQCTSLVRYILTECLGGNN